MAYDIANIATRTTKISNRLVFLKTKKFDELVKLELEQKLKEDNIQITVIDQKNADFKIISSVFISASKNDFYLDFTGAVNIQNQARMYHYRSRQFKRIEEIEENLFNQISLVAFYKILDLILLDLNNKINYSIQDRNLQERCIPILGKTWEKIGLFMTVNYNYIKNDQNLCIANLKDNFGVEFSGYPHVYIF